MREIFARTTAIALALCTKIYRIKEMVYQRLGFKISTKALKVIATRKGWIATGAAGDFRRKQTWLDVYNALMEQGHLPAAA